MPYRRRIYSNGPRKYPFSISPIYRNRRIVPSFSWTVAIIQFKQKRFYSPDSMLLYYSFLRLRITFLSSFKSVMITSICALRNISNKRVFVKISPKAKYSCSMMLHWLVLFPHHLCHPPEPSRQSIDQYSQTKNKRYLPQKIFPWCCEWIRIALHSPIIP